MPKFLIVISGPTAVGKTEISIELAQKYQCPIISADSRQVYKYLDIGTAKPTILEQKGVRHYFIDHINPDITFTAGQFECEVIMLLNKLYRTTEVVIMSGGTGMYIDAVTEGLDEFPIIPKPVKLALLEDMNNCGLEELCNELKLKDLEYYNIVDLSNSRRVLRALEVIRSSGKPYSSFLRKKKKNRNFSVIYIQLDRNREELYNQINNRVDEMINNGLVDEVKSLIKYRNNSALDTVGYREIFDFIDNRISLKKAIEEIKKNTRRYAKRQMTWFRRSTKWKVFRADDKEKIIEYLATFIPD